MKKVTDRNIIAKIKAYCKENCGAKAIGEIKELHLCYIVDIIIETPQTHATKVTVSKRDIGE